jgi:hypothetical protein
MPTISGLVKALSADVVTRLAALSTPLALTFGGVLMSRAHVYEGGAPNRIVMIPTTSDFGAKDVSSASNVQGYPSAEIQTEWSSHTVGTEFPTFLCQCWGQANPPDPDFGDYDVTQALYQTVMLSARALVSGSRVSFTRGVWINQKPDGGQLDVAGCVFELGIRFDTPVTELVGSIVTATPKPTAYYLPPGGTPPGEAAT